MTYRCAKIKIYIRCAHRFIMYKNWIELNLKIFDQ